MCRGGVQLGMGGAFWRRTAFLTDMSILLYKGTNFPLLVCKGTNLPLLSVQAWPCRGCCRLPASAHGLAAEGSADDVRASPSHLHASILLGPQLHFSTLPMAMVPPATPPMASLCRWCSRLRMRIDACALPPPGTPSEFCCMVHRLLSPDDTARIREVSRRHRRAGHVSKASRDHV
jgi:hypothetical protein